MGLIKFKVVMANKHVCVFKAKVDMSNGQRFITERCECGASRQRSESVKGQSQFHKTYGKIHCKKQQ